MPNLESGQPGFLIALGALVGVAADRFGNAARQRTNARVRQEDFVARHGKFVTAKLFVGEQFGQPHAWR